jgi:hypothetical protein
MTNTENLPAEYTITAGKTGYLIKWQGRPAGKVSYRNGATMADAIAEAWGHRRNILIAQGINDGMTPAEAIAAANR